MIQVYAEELAIQCVLKAVSFTHCLQFEISHPGVVNLFWCFWRKPEDYAKVHYLPLGYGVWGQSYLVNCSLPVTLCFSSNNLHLMMAWPGLIWPCFMQNMQVRMIFIYPNCWTCCWFSIFDRSSQATFGFTTS